jgi:microcystin-dependent protein
MADTYTPNFSWTLPEIGASRDSWGSKLNANLTSIDQFVAFACPIGIIADFAGPTAPSGWLMCDGRLVSRTTYSALFAAIGTYWGAGDGSTTFALPNVNGRAAIGPGTVIDQNSNSYAFSFATTQGFLSNPILQANLPNYNLVTDAQGNHNHGGYAVGANHDHTTDNQGNHSHGGATATESNTHTHSGVSDIVGAHLHNVPAWGAVGGGAQVAPGVVATGNSVQTDTQGLHQHNISTGTESALHTHSISVDGLHAHTTTYSGNLYSTIAVDGYHYHNVALGGGGQWLWMQNPIVVVTKIIYAGSQASTATATATAATSATSPAATELDELRGEIAELRALLLAPHAVPRRRTLSSPLRGVH